MFKDTAIADIERIESSLAQLGPDLRNEVTGLVLRYFKLWNRERTLVNAEYFEL